VSRHTQKPRGPAGAPAKTKTTLTKTGAQRPNGRMTRAEKAEHTRTALFQAAAEVVGKVGYAEASIAEITRLAGVAQGTFYRYFETRQELFDQLLPKVAVEVEEYLRERVHGSKTGVEVEERSLRAFMEYVVENRRYLRILNEAETLAPKAYRAQFKYLTKRYVASLKLSFDRGELGAYDERDLEVIAHLLISARSYLALRFTVTNNTVRPPPEYVLKAYMRFVAAGLSAPPLSTERNKP
jgi:AcrR family transcriptional regulator